jgi:hypothetical protein
LVTVNQVRWANIFEFTHLFRSFKMATNPAKLIIALVAIMVMYGTGRLFDTIWGPQAGEGEIENYQRMDATEFDNWQRNDALGFGNRVMGQLALHPGEKTPTMEELEYLKKSPRSAYSTIKGNLIDEFHKRVEQIHKQREADEKDVADRIKRGEKIDPRDQTPAELERDRLQKAAGELQTLVAQARQSTGRGVFDAFLTYEIEQFNMLVNFAFSPAQIAPQPGDTAALKQSNTVVGCIKNIVITGPKWLFTASGPMGAGGGFWMRLLYVVTLLIFGGVFLVVTALAGGVICRLTALEYAGLERPPLAEVFGFARRKLWTLVTAPLTPFVILLVGGLGVAIISMAGAIPYVGEILAGILFVISLAAGFVLMLVLLGILAGYNLIYPTVCTEGSDTFDAMSRAFAYVYARPWRMIFYTLIIIVYGAVTLLFLKIAIFLLLWVTHVFAGWGINFFGAAYGTYTGLPKLETMWPTPEIGNLARPANWSAMSGTEYVGALMLNFWVYALVSVLGAYVVSYYHSAHTILYFLMRRSVEGVSLTEVYQEEIPAASATMQAAEKIEPPAIPAAGGAAPPPIPSSEPPAVPASEPPPIPPAGA